MSALVWVAVVIFIDQISKFFIVRSVGRGESIEVWGRFFQITQAHNHGGAFGVFQNNEEAGNWITLVASLISIGIIAALFSGRVHDRTLKSGLVLIAGGAIGNLFDRFHYGYVIDFLHFSYVSHFNFPVFNLADTAIVVGTGLVVLSLLKRREEPSETSSHETTGSL